MAIQTARPSGKLYGLTHEIDGKPRIIEPRTVKVGIGLPKGKALHAYIDNEGKWVVVLGAGQGITRERFDTKREAQRRYRELKKTAPERKYPERLRYFTFLHVSADGDFEPDWEIIESHGSIPTEIDIIFVRDDPWSAAYQMWSATAKLCEGDGKIALRSNSLAQTKEEKDLATMAEKIGEKYFPVNQCWLAGCPYSKGHNGKAPACKPMGRLFFQLLNSPRLGATAVFHTAGRKSISQIFSAIEIFKRATGRGDPDNGFVAGIPLKMVLRPYRVTYNGRTATQYAVALEFRASSALTLKKSLIEQAVQFRMAGADPLRQLKSFSEPGPPIQEPPGFEESPAAITAEFESGVDEPEAPEETIQEAADFLDESEGESIESTDTEIPSDIPTHGDTPREPLQNGSAPASSNPQPASENHPSQRASQAEIRDFYDLCRRQGMTDKVILDHLGSLGFESINEITWGSLHELVEWAKQYHPPQQGNLI